MSKLPSISSLMSPPETKPLDSFSSPSTPQLTSLPVGIPSSYIPENTLPPMVSSESPESKTLRVLPSPPVSPWKGHQHRVEQIAVKIPEALRDPVLYPSTEVGDGTITEPLFPTTPERLAAEEIVTKHMACHLQQFDKRVNRPTRDEYLLALSCVATIGNSYNRNPGQYMKRARAEMEEYYYKAKRICARPGTTTMPVIKIAPAPSPVARQPRMRAVPAVKQPKTPKAKPPFTRVRKPKPSPKEGLLGTPGLERLGTPDSQTPGAKRDPDVHYDQITDYCPPISTLTNGKALKVEWTSNHLDLSDDPDRHLLHEAEVTAAGVLRLSCAVYLCSKRRIFEGRLRALKNGKEFRKTDAQQACKIDVNKASKLWTAFEKVGWFHPSHFQKYL